MEDYYEDFKAAPVPMNQSAKVCLSGPSASVSGSSRASEDFQCEICKKFFKEKKNLNTSTRGLSIANVKTKRLCVTIACKALIP